MTHAEKKSSALEQLATADQPTDGSPFWIGDSFVEPRLNQITSGGQTRHIEHRVMRVLLFLAAHPDQPLSRDAILKSVWAETVPNDEGLTQAVCKLRKALGDRPGKDHIIQTIRKVGYRLVTPVSLAPVPTRNATVSMSTEYLGGSPTRHIRIRLHGRSIAAVAFVFVTLLVVLQAA